MAKTHEDWMRRAIALASENVRQTRGGPFASVIVRDGLLIAEGANAVTAANDPTAHGEIVAIRLACQALGTFSLTGCILYTSAEPCPMCLAAMYWSRLDEFFFGNTADDAARAGFDDAKIYRELALAPEDRLVHGTRLLRDEAAENFRVWVGSPLRTDY